MDQCADKKQSPVKKLCLGIANQRTFAHGFRKQCRKQNLTIMKESKSISSFRSGLSDPLFTMSFMAHLHIAASVAKVESGDSRAHWW